MRMAKSKWMKPRHRVVRNILYVLLYPYCRFKYGLKVEKFKEQNGRQYLVLLNHQTPFDQFFVGMSFKGAVYYLATEDIFSKGWISSVIRYLIAPIPIKKQTTDIVAVKNCLRVAREGGTIAIAPEGNRTYSGRTEYMNPAIVSLAKKLHLPIALYRVEGGYGAQPRWSDVVRRGSVRAYVHRVIEPAEYDAMTDDELFAAIEEGLAVDEATDTRTYRHKKRAEYLERAIYVCPYCGLSAFESHGHLVECCTCGRQIEYTPTTRLQGVGFEFPFAFVADWYRYQKDFVNKLDVTQHIDSPLFRDTATISEVIVNQKKAVLRRDAAVALYGDRVVIDEGTADEWVFSFETATAVTVLGRNKLNIYSDGRVFQLRGGKRFNALKYVNIYYRYKNISRGDCDGEFLGL